MSTTQPGGGAPAPIEYTLPSGRVVQWRAPDTFAVIAFAGTLPDPITAATIKLLVAEGAFTPEDDPRYYMQQAERIRGMYGLVAHGLIRPRLDVSREWGDSEVLGRCDIAYGDVEHLYWLFRVGNHQSNQGERADPDHTGGVAPVAPIRDGVPE